MLKFLLQGFLQLLYSSTFLKQFVFLIYQLLFLLGLNMLQLLQKFHLVRDAFFRRQSVTWRLVFNAFIRFLYFAILILIWIIQLFNSKNFILRILFFLFRTLTTLKRQRLRLRLFRILTRILHLNDFLRHQNCTLFLFLFIIWSRKVFGKLIYLRFNFIPILYIVASFLVVYLI